MATEVRQVYGSIFKDGEMKSAEVMVTVTSNHAGEVMSLGADGLSISIPIKELEKIIQKARKR